NHQSSLEDVPEVVSEIEGTIRSYMNEHLFSSELSLSKMSSDIGFNSNYLSGVFKQIYGVPFQDYVNRKRMEKAKLLLLSTSMRNYEVAEEIGIEDVNYFVTKFKKLWGVTPKQFRQGVR
ncbi:helix-turn-helix domain-containing protein, partial [Bacillus licheniformis]|uniref:helix-turn-helix domain-containing protein n=1 Tax=Bacillus licheniformis TaxID=1402 RepID=UPI000F5F00BE